MVTNVMLTYRAICELFSREESISCETLQGEDDPVLAAC